MRMAGALCKARIVGGRDEVYVAAMPLRATRGPPQLVMSAAYSLSFWDLQHFMVILKPSSSISHSQRCWKENVGFSALYHMLTSDSKELVASSEFQLHNHASYIQVLVFDFQPKDPEDIYVALAVLSGRAVPGAVLVRKMKTLPRSKCWFVGYSKDDAVGIASEFNKTWDSNLRVGLHDCRDYTNGLVKQLTGEKDVLRRLRSTGS